MKHALLAFAGLLGSAAANLHNHKHAFFHERRALASSKPETCACTTYTEYYYGEGTRTNPPFTHLPFSVLHS